MTSDLAVVMPSLGRGVDRDEKMDLYALGFVLIFHLRQKIDFFGLCYLQV